jgi:hypothetical protein
MTKLMKFKEGIISAYEIYDSPSFFNRIFNISYTFDAMRFEYKYMHTFHQMIIQYTYYYCIV